MAHCDPNKRTAHHSAEFKKKLINRLKRIEGQIRGVQRMLEDDVYCDDVINQINASRSALASVTKELFEAHLATCVLEQIKSGSDEVIEELKKTIERITKS